MKRRLSCYAVSCFFLFAANSQLSVSLHEPLSGIVQKSQLWNIILIYSGNSPINVTIGLSLFDIRDNQPVMTALTRPVAITKGAKQLRGSEIAPIDYNYFSPALDVSRASDAFLPVGNYRACYTIFAGERHSEGVLAEDCMNFEVSPLSPPQLNLPADSSAVETPYPQFSWLPPIPAILFRDLNYDIIVTEVLPDQTASEAIRENLPVYFSRRITSIAANYPNSNKSLDTAKTYAWKVIAKNGEAFAAQTETWTFRIASKKPEQLSPTNGTYLELKSDNTYINTAQIPDNILGIKFYSYEQTHEGAIRIFDSKGQLLEEDTRAIRYGDNFLVLRLNHSFYENENYFIEIPDQENKHYRGSFRIVK